jgi:hypothetical protein
MKADESDPGSGAVTIMRVFPMQIRRRGFKMRLPSRAIAHQLRWRI